MIGDAPVLEFHVLLERIYSSDLGKHVEPGTILFPLAVVSLSREFVIMNTKAWAMQGNSNIDISKLDVLRFSVSTFMSAQKPFTRSLGSKFNPLNPLSPEEIQLFKLLYAS